MDTYSKLLTIVDDEKVELALGVKDLLHKELVLGQTRYVCRYGTLSDGHENITPSRQYYQATKELWYIGSSIRSNKANAMLAQADAMEAEEALAKAETPAQRLRAEAKALQAKERLLTALVTVEDQMRMLDEYLKIREELGPQVRAQYPEGIEQAERDNWHAVAQYRLVKGMTPGLAKERMDNVPLSPEDKAKLGLEAGRPDMQAPLMVTAPKKFMEIRALVANEQPKQLTEVK